MRQPAVNATFCLPCERGAFCTEGATAPLPCPEGTHSDATNLGSAVPLHPAGAAVQGWIHSPGHRKNLLSLTNVCGIGVGKNGAEQIYFTQLFAKTSAGLA